MPLTCQQPSCLLTVRTVTRSSSTASTRKNRIQRKYRAQSAPLLKPGRATQTCPTATPGTRISHQHPSPHGSAQQPKNTGPTSPSGGGIAAFVLRTQTNRKRSAAIEHDATTCGPANPNSGEGITANGRDSARQREKPIVAVQGCQRQGRYTYLLHPPPGLFRTLPRPLCVAGIGLVTR